MLDKGFTIKDYWMGIGFMTILRNLLANACIRSLRGGHHQASKQLFIHSSIQTLALFYIRFVEYQLLSNILASVDQFDWNFKQILIKYSGFNPGMDRGLLDW